MPSRSPDEIVAEIDRKQNEEDKDLIPRAGRVVAGAAKKIYNSATGKGAEDFEPKQTYDVPDKNGNAFGTMPETDAVRSANSIFVRPLNMGIKSKATKASEYKKGGKVKASSASKRADGCCIKGKTKGRMV
jgi:hypothetical protein